MDPTTLVAVVGIDGFLDHLQLDVPVHPYAVAEGTPLNELHSEHSLTIIILDNPDRENCQGSCFPGEPVRAFQQCATDPLLTNDYDLKCRPSTPIARVRIAGSYARKRFSIKF
jgi:hypothetical protein